MKNGAKLLGIAFAITCVSLIACRGEKKTSPKPMASQPQRLVEKSPRPTSSARPTASPSTNQTTAVLASTLRVRSSDTKDIGPACELAAISTGLVLRMGEDDLSFATYREGSITALAADAKCVATGPVSVIRQEPHRAYYISKSSILRREIRADGSMGPSETTVRDAADFTRLAVVRSIAGDLVAYIGREVSHEHERGAKIWLEARESKRITPDGSGATSIALGQANDRSFVFLALDGRTSMSPVHATRIEVDAAGMRIGDDRVVYVAPGAERRTELRFFNNGEASLAIVPISHEASKFGLLNLRLDTAEQEAPSQLYEYPNGLDPAPVATARLCGKELVALVRPDTADAKSEHAIELVTFDELGRLVEKRKLLTAHGIKQLVMSSVDDGKAAGYLAYTSAGRTQVAMLHCE